MQGDGRGESLVDFIANMVEGYDSGRTPGSADDLAGVIVDALPGFGLFAVDTSLVHGVWWCEVELVARMVRPDRPWGIHECSADTGCRWMIMAPDRRRVAE